MPVEVVFNKKYPPRNDVVFSIMFGDMELFSRLLKVVTGHTLHAKEIISQANVPPDNVEHNYIRFDTYAKDENGTIYSIDLQNTYSEMLIKNRTIYYACRALSSQTVEKGKYEKLNKVVVSFILTSKKSDLPVEVITLQNQQHETYSDLLTLHNVYTQTVSQSESIQPDDELKMISEFFSVADEEQMQIFAANYKENELVKRLLYLYGKATCREDLDYIEKGEYFDMKITEQDINEAKNQAHAEGLEEGIEKGMTKGFLKALIELVKDGLLSATDAAGKANMPLSEFQELVGLAT